MNIRISTEIDRKYNFVELSVFLSSQYKEYIGNKLRKKYYYVYANENDIEFIFPIIINTKLIKKCQIIDYPFNLDLIELAPEKEKEIWDSFIKYCKQYKFCDIVIQPPNYLIFKSYPANSKCVMFGTYLIDVENFSEDEIFNRFNRQSRKKIRKIDKLDIVVSIENILDNEIYSVLMNSMKHSNLAVTSYNQIKNLYESLSENCLTITASENQVIYSVYLIIYDKYCAYTLYSGSRENIPNGINNYLIWECIKKLKEKGVKKINFVGARINPPKDSKYYRIQEFKASFGGELKTGYIWKKEINNPKCLFYYFALKMYHVLKGKHVKEDIIDQERKRIEKDNINN
ncbi:MAG: peptidoglycan bridge formation glycyltransferase FemA/FemB family protein [Saprospiraceae bacterium]|nr:peptidoglycan bridge formation glycyltransferase FemA/FemB family protein [Saprospiraceae bacterium]